MPLSYAGVSLPLETDEVKSYLEIYHNLDRLVEQSLFGIPGSGLDNLDTPPYRWAESPKIGVLTWPRDCSRTATFHAVVNNTKLTQIRTATASNPYQNLVLSDGVHSPVTASMRMLPPRPLFQITGTEQLYLLTLVDRRFDWTHNKSGNVSSVPGTWLDLWEGISSSGLGVTLASDSVDADYASPSERWLLYRKPLTVLLDTSANTVGQKFYVNLAGTLVTSATWSTALASSNTQYSLYKRCGGGKLSIEDIGRHVPASVVVVFGKKTGGVFRDDPYVVTKTFAATKPTEYGTATGLANATHTIFADLIYDGTNATACDNYATQAATDFYGWQLCDIDATFAGIVPWTPTGAEDVIEWTYSISDPGPRLTTRVQRGPWAGYSTGGYKIEVAGTSTASGSCTCSSYSGATGSVPVGATGNWFTQSSVFITNNTVNSGPGSQFWQFIQTANNPSQSTTIPHWFQQYIQNGPTLYPGPQFIQSVYTQGTNNPPAIIQTINTASGGQPKQYIQTITLPPSGSQYQQTISVGPGVSPTQFVQTLEPTQYTITVRVTDGSNTNTTTTAQTPTQTQQTYDIPGLSTPLIIRITDDSGDAKTTVLGPPLNLCGVIDVSCATLTGLPTYTKLSGSGTYKVPEGVTKIGYRLIGGGGGGGKTATGGGGGGGGGYRYGELSVSAGDLISYSQGSGGAGSTSTFTQGDNGTNTTFGAISAGGGQGALGATGAGGGPGPPDGNVGSNASGSTGGAGGASGAGVDNPGAGGAGGSSGGNGSNGSDGSIEVWPGGLPVTPKTENTGTAYSVLGVAGGASATRDDIAVGDPMVAGALGYTPGVGVEWKQSGSTYSFLAVSDDLGTIGFSTFTDDFITTPIGVAKGGTGSDLSATGPGVLRQPTSGAALTVYQGAAIADVPTGGSATAAANATAINAILARLRSANLIAT